MAIFSKLFGSGETKKEEKPFYDIQSWIEWKTPDWAKGPDADRLEATYRHYKRPNFNVGEGGQWIAPGLAFLNFNEFWFLVHAPSGIKIEDKNVQGEIIRFPIFVEEVMKFSPITDWSKDDALHRLRKHPAVLSPEMESLQRIKLKPKEFKKYLSEFPKVPEPYRQEILMYERCFKNVAIRFYEKYFSEIDSMPSIPDNHDYSKYNHPKKFRFQGKMAEGFQYLHTNRYGRNYYSQLIATKLTSGAWAICHIPSGRELFKVYNYPAALVALEKLGQVSWNRKDAPELFLEIYKKPFNNLSREFLKSYLPGKELSSPYFHWAGFEYKLNNSPAIETLDERYVSMTDSEYEQLEADNAELDEYMDMYWSERQKVKEREEEEERVRREEEEEEDRRRQEEEEEEERMRREEEEEEERLREIEALEQALREAEEEEERVRRELEYEERYRNDNDDRW